MDSPGAPVEPLMHHVSRRHGSCATPKGWIRLRPAGVVGSLAAEARPVLVGLVYEDRDLAVEHGAVQQQSEEIAKGAVLEADNDLVVRGQSPGVAQKRARQEAGVG